METLTFLIILIAAVVIVRRLFGGADAATPASTRRGQNASATSEAAWIPAGHRVEIGGFAIDSGMIYVGGRLPSLRGHSDADPALINPDLPVSQRASVKAGEDMGYWPAYSQISATARAGYLKWLSGGRRDPDASIGYVFLFFYGIERRALYDAQHSEAAKREVPSLLEEVRSLLLVYGGNRSVRGYFSRFLDIVGVSQGLLDREDYVPPLAREASELPIALQIGLGNLIKAGEAIPPLWALSWTRCHLELPLRTPAERCAEEFNALFQIRYAEEYGDGMRIPCGTSRLSLIYRPASSSFPNPVELKVGNLPDVSRLSAPVRRLHAIAATVQDELDAYSRWLGKSPDRSSPAALALLPRELVSDRMGKEAKALAALIDTRLDADGVALLRTDELIAHFPSKDVEKLSKKERCLVGDFLASIGFGIEPDARYEGANLNSHAKAAIFRLDGKDSPPGAGFAPASALLHLGAAVVAADDQITEAEERHLELQLETVLNLPVQDRRRLRAHLKWLLADPPTIRRLKGQVEVLSESMRHSLGQYLITVAGADGNVSATELKLLTKIYPILGLDINDVYRDVHAIAASGPAIATEPVTVIEADEKKRTFTIPAPKPPAQSSDSSVFVLDPRKVAAIREQSKRATEVLGGIFSEPEPEEVGDETMDVSTEGPEARESIGGLDRAHSALLKLVIGRGQIDWTQFGQLADDLGLLPGGAAEVINEASFEVCGEPLLEGDETLEVNEFAAQELLA